MKIPAPPDPKASTLLEIQDMASTEDRIRQIIADNLDIGREPDFSARLGDSGVSSVDCIAFYKLVNSEFGLGLVAEECRQFETLNQLVEHINQKAA